MIELLYFVLVYPLESALLWVLRTANALTGSYGVAIVLLSLCFNVALLPFYHLAERVLERERAIRRRLAPKEKEFRAVFRGQERYFMLRALYRMHGYHPIYALRSLLPLLLQVPFFIATYSLLSDFGPMRGTSFLFLPDLGRPDGLIGGINLMPLLMTAINLASGIIYTQQFGLREQTQVWAVALIFLVLLYAAPSGLVLYWTVSNLFSLLKNCIYARLAAPVPVEAAR